MFAIQATDCNGTALTVTTFAKPATTRSTAIAQMLATKTGFAPNGDRNRTATFVVTGPTGTTTFTRVPQGLRNDETDEVHRTATEIVRPCTLCGADEVAKTHRVQTIAGGLVRLCDDCLVVDAA